MTYHDNTMGPMRSTLTEVWPVAKVLELKDKFDTTCNDRGARERTRIANRIRHPWWSW